MFYPIRQNNLSPLWWFYTPWLFFVFLIGIHHTHSILGLSKSEYEKHIYSELGLIEGLQAICLFAAFIVAIVIIIKNMKNTNPWLKAWVGLAAMGSLYVFLEEISYGQHLAGWETPLFWQDVNDQQETNFHNTSSWLDQKPRLILEIGVIIGGIIIPLLKRFNPKALPKKFEIIYPTQNLFWIAVLAEFSHLIEEIKDLIQIGFLENSPIFFEYLNITRPSEAQEMFYFYFTLLYLIELKTRLQESSKNSEN